MIRHRRVQEMTIPTFRGFEACFFTSILLFVWLFLVPPVAMGAGGPENDIFAIEVGNYWNYQGEGYVWRDEVGDFDDRSEFPNTYRIDSFEDTSWAWSNWVEVKPGELLEWGSEDDYELWIYSKPILVAWYPVAVNEQRSSEAVVDEYFSIRLTVDALGTEAVDLGFDAFQAQKLRYSFTGIYTDPEDPGNSFEDTSVYYYWIVPYIGKIKYQDDQYTELLTSFGILGGTVTQDTDTDGDCLKDYQELVFHETGREDPDTDDDGFSDFVEVGAGSNPLEESSVPSCPGDFDRDGDVDKDDLAQFAGNYGKAQCGCPCNGDFNGDADMDGVDLFVFARSAASGQCL